MAQISMLSFDEDGAQTMLGSVEEIESAIAGGRITSDTPVTVYMSDRRKSRHPAGEHPDLGQFFPKTPEPEAEPELEPEPEPEQIEDPKGEFDPEPAPVDDGHATTAMAEPKPSPAPVTDPVSNQSAETPPPRQDTAPDYAALLAEARARDRKTLKVILGCVAGGVVLVGGAAWIGLSRGDSSDDYDYEAVASSSEAAMDAAVADTGNAQSFYLARWTNVRASPSVDSADVGRIERGSSVSGTLTAPDSRGRQWLRLDAGPYAGNYISSANFMAVEPPPIDTATAGEYRLIEASDIFAGPSDSAPRVSGTVSSYPQAHKFEAFGGVNGFAEVGLEDGGVGYIPWTKTNTSHLDYPARRVFVRNRCRDVKYVVFTYRENGSWQTSTPLWTLPAGASGDLQMNGRTIYVDTPEMYYHDFGSSNPNSGGKRFYVVDKKNININGQTDLMTTVIPEVYPDNYQLIFC